MHGTASHEYGRVATMPVRAAPVQLEGASFAVNSICSPRTLTQMASFFLDLQVQIEQGGQRWRCGAALRRSSGVKTHRDVGRHAGFPEESAVASVVPVQLKLEASSALPVPLYFATCG